MKKISKMKRYCTTIIAVVVVFISMIFLENSNALENNNIQIVDDVTLSENRIILDKRDATNVDVSVSGISGYEVIKDVKGEKCGATEWASGQICPYGSFSSNTAHLVKLPNTNLNNAVITFIYNKVGTYNGREIGAKLTISNINIYDTTYDKRYFEISNKFYDGYAFLYLESFKASYDFFYTSDSSKSPISLKNAYLTVNSCNYYHDTRLGDESVYFDNEQLNTIKSVLVIKNSNMSVSTNLHNGKYAFGVTPISNDFTDTLGGSTFERNSVTFEVTGSFGYYYDSSTEIRQSAWRTVSSAMVTPTNEVPTPENPKKSIIDANNRESIGVSYKSGEEYTFVIRQKAHDLGVNILTRYKSFIMKDALPSQVEYIDAKMYDKDNNLVNDGTINYDTSNHTVTWTASNNFLNTMPLEGETYTLKIKVKIKSGIHEKFTNKSTTLINNTSADSNIVTLYTPTKKYASDTPHGKDGGAVQVGNDIKYSISYTNAYSTNETVTITDILSKGLEYVNGSANLGNPTITSNSDGTTKLVWTRSVNAESSEQLTYNAKVTSAARVSNVVSNNAKVKIGNNIEVTLEELKNPVPVKEYASDTQAGKNGAVVKRDDVIKYSIKYSNPSNESKTIRIVDTLSKGLSYVGSSGKVNNAVVNVSTTTNSAGQTVITMTKSIAAGASEEFTYNAKITGETTLVDNNATIKYNSLPEISLDQLKNSVPRKEYASDSPSGKNNSAVAKGSIIKYSIKYANTLSSTTPVTIKDTISKGLDFVSGSAKMGGTIVTPVTTSNSDGSTTLTFTKNVSSGASEELVYNVKVNGKETVVKNSAKIKYDNGPEISLNELKNSVPSKEYSSSTTVGAGNKEVKNGDKIKYSIKYANMTSGSSTVTIKDTLSKGLSYISGSSVVGATAVTPTVKNNSDGTTTLIWTKIIASGATETLEYEAKVEKAATLVQNGATIKYGNDSEIMLDKLKNAVPTKEYNPDTPSGLNGDVIKKGDTINYVIKYANAYSTNQTVTITDTLSKGLSYVSGSANLGNPTITNNSDGSTKMVWTKLVTSGVVEELKYSVKATGEKVLVENSANVKFGNNPLVDLNKLKNPAPRKEYAFDSPSGKNGAAVGKGDIIKYNIGYANVFSNTETVVITDVLSKGLRYVSGSAKAGSVAVTPTITNNSDGTTKLVFRKSLSSGAEESLVYSVKVDGGVKEAKNNAQIKYNSTGTEIKLDELKNPIPSKEYASNTSNGKEGASVQKGETIKYSIKYGDRTGVNSTITITDTLSKGLSYVEGSAKVGESVINPSIVNNSDGTTVLTWTKTLNANASEELVYSVKTTGNATIVNNKAKIKYGNNPEINLGELKNSVPSKSYAADSPNGKNNAAVKKEEQIKYSIKYANTTNSSSPIVITDTISKGLSYVDGSAKIGGVSITPIKTINSDGTAKLVFNKSIAANTSEELVYSVKVTEGETIVNNKAKIKYGNNPEINLGELKNPVPNKMYASDTQAGKNSTPVSKGEKIKYTIKYSNANSGKDVVVITDTLSKGLEYVKGSAKVGNTSVSPTVTKNSDKTTTITLSKPLAGNTIEELTYEALVVGNVPKVENSASIKYNNNAEITLTKLINPLQIDKTIDVPDTGSFISILEIILGISLISGGGYTVYRKYKEKA